MEWAKFSREVLIKASKLTKKYDNFVAVDSIDFEVYKGECVGFLGPNGAGKTTTVRMMYCFLAPHLRRINPCRLKRKHNAEKSKKLSALPHKKITLTPTSLC